MIRALTTSSLAVGFALAAVQCLCGISVRAEACHVQPVEAACCCAESGGSVTDSPQELPSALQSSTPRFPGPESHAGLQSARPSGASGSRQTHVALFHSVAARPMSSLYLMNATFLI